MSNKTNLEWNKKEFEKLLKDRVQTGKELRDKYELLNGTQEFEELYENYQIWIKRTERF